MIFFRQNSKVSKIVFGVSRRYPAKYNKISNGNGHLFKDLQFVFYSQIFHSFFSLKKFPGFDNMGQFTDAVPMGAIFIWPKFKDPLGGGGFIFWVWGFIFLFGGEGALYLRGVILFLPGSAGNNPHPSRNPPPKPPCPHCVSWGNSGRTQSTEDETENGSPGCNTVGVRTLV